MLDIDWYQFAHVAGQFMLVGGLAGTVADVMNRFYPTTIDGKPLTSFFTPE